MRAPRLLYPVRPGGDDVTTQLITQPYHLPRNGGPARWHLGALLTFKATSEQTAGALGQGTPRRAGNGDTGAPTPPRGRGVLGRVQVISCGRRATSRTRSASSRRRHDCSSSP